MNQLRPFLIFILVFLGVAPVARAQETVGHVTEKNFGSSGHRYERNNAGMSAGEFRRESSARVKSSESSQGATTREIQALKDQVAAAKN